MRAQRFIVPFCLMVLAASVASIVALADQPKTDSGKAPPTTDAQAAQQKVDFVADIQPLLADRCYKCHGAEKHESGLRLHSKSDAMAGGDSGVAITPGKGADSRLVKYIAGDDPDLRMPPDGEGQRLSPEEVSLFRRWIDQGAIWPDSADAQARLAAVDHWAYKKTSRPTPPDVAHKELVRTTLDRFLLARLESLGLAYSQEADRPTLLRRVTLDLTGLPPTPGEVDAFVADTSDNAYEKVVDRLLASPHFGERWARMWLDLARYADSHGYEKDPLRSVWPYRDWVVNALNVDMPFDQFTIEQLAGDLLPHPTLAQRIATGFHRNTMINTEGGTDDEEFRSAAVVDRVNTTATVWLGSTMACCQCHSHKYDPFSQREYYQMYAVFNTTADPGRSNGPQVDIPPENSAEINARIAEVSARLNADTPEFFAKLAEWESSALKDATQWIVLDNIEFQSEEDSTWEKQPDGSILLTGKAPEKDRYTIKTKLNGSRLTAIRLEAMADERLPAGGPGRSSGGNFVLSKMHLSIIKPGAQPNGVDISSASADFSQPNYPAAGVVYQRQKGPGWAVYPQVGQSHELVLETNEPLTGSDELTMTFENNYGDQHSLGRFRISMSDAPRPKDGRMPTSVEFILRIPAENRTSEQRSAVAEYYRSIAPEFAADRKKLAKLQAMLKPVATSLVMQELPKPRKTRVHLRGNFLTLGEAVSAGVPAVLGAMPSDETVNRLTFARWLVSKDNPLTARVTVNHFWEQLFGQGLVVTSEDFGTKGDAPSHPELLDWLANDFVDSGWQVKALIKSMVMSTAYRQTARATPELLDRDPRNQLLARGPRMRLEAEMIRDQALSIGGLLSPKMGGPAVMPPVPEGVMVKFEGSIWVESKGEDRYRRAIYSSYRRTMPYPSLMGFDAPSREYCVARRPRSNTPLQALNILNDPVYVEAAQGLARRMVSEGGSTAAERATRGFRLTLARSPKPAELARLIALFEQERDRFRRDSDAARKLITNEAIKDPPKGMDESELAAWTVVANVLLNLDETMTRG